jgi:hypothetical protein
MPKSRSVVGSGTLSPVKLNVTALAEVPMNPSTIAATVRSLFIKNTLSATTKKQS